MPLIFPESFFWQVTLALLALTASLALLIASAEKLVDALESLGKFFSLSEYILGITVLAMGTSLPEMITALFSLADSQEDIVGGMVVGSNIANILFIMGSMAVFSKGFPLTQPNFRVEFPFLVISALILPLFLYPLGAATGKAATTHALLTPWEGCFLLVIYAIYISSFFSRVAPESEREQVFRWGWVFWVCGGLFGVALGAQFTVTSVNQLALLFGVGEGIIAASIVALGTSLPELVVSLSSIRRGRIDMALGNVVGSNMFNTCIVLGVSAIVSPFFGGPLRMHEPALIYFQIPFYLGVSLLLISSYAERHFSRKMGVFFLFAYFLFNTMLYQSF